MSRRVRDKCESDSADSDEEESEDEAATEGLLNLIRKTGGREVLDLPFEASTYDGLALSGILFFDDVYRTQEGFSGAFLQLIYMMMLHLFAVLGQFFLVHWTFLASLETGYDLYVQAEIDADTIEEALSHKHPVSLSNSTDVRIVEWCNHDSTHLASHIIVMAIWATRMIMEIADASWRFYRIWSLNHARQRRLVDWKKESPSVTSLTPGLKIFLITLLSVPQFLIAISLSWTGAKLLESAQSMPNLVLKALTLQYIIGLDELVFTAFSSVRFKKVANSMKFVVVMAKSTHDWRWRVCNVWRAWGSNTLKLVASLTYLALTCYVFRDVRRLRYDCREYFRIFPEESHVHAKHWMFGKTPDWMASLF